MYPCRKGGCIGLADDRNSLCAPHRYQGLATDSYRWLARLKMTTQAKDLDGPERFPPTPWDDEPPFWE